MKYKKTALSIAVVSVLAACQSTQVEDKTLSQYQPETSSHMSQGVYLVEFNSAQVFHTQAKQLSSTLSTYCAQDATLDSVKQQWHQTMVSWMALQGQERGPEAALEQSWNIQFWPDKKNTTGRKMSALIKQSAPVTPSEISMQSVTVQGLGSIEWLLYDAKSDITSNTQTCAKGVAISQNIVQNATTIADAWQQNPWTDLDEKQWESEYVALLSNQLEYSMKKMSRPLANFGQPRPYFAESWRSETSMINLEANIHALKQLYYADGKGLDALLRQKDKQRLADSIVTQLDMMVETWPTDQSLFTMLQSKEGYRAAYSQFNKLEQLRYLIHEEVAIELGVIIGFNATDGD